MTKLQQQKAARFRFDDNHIKLVTTELQETWPKTGNILFLGEWCKLHKKKAAWDLLNSKTQSFRWDDRNKLEADFHYLQSFNKEILKESVPILNYLHRTEYGEKSWELLIGYWISIFTTVLFDRWHSIKHAYELHGKLETNVLPQDLKHLARNTTANFISSAAEDPYWNHMVYTLIIDQFPNIDKNLIHGVTRSKSKIQLSSSFFSAQLKPAIKKFLSFISYLPKKGDEVLFFKSYIDKKLLRRLNLRFKQSRVTVDYISPPGEFKYCGSYRDWILEGSTPSDAFKNFARGLVPILLPKVFLEGFDASRFKSQRLMLPKSPKAIFTAVSHFSDDMFSFYCVDKLSLGAKLIVGEHGGLGVGKINASHSFELSIADTYCSTGWVDKDHQKIVPIGNFRQPYLADSRKRERSGNAIIVCGNMPRYVFDARSMALSSQTIEYFEGMFDFYGYLHSSVKSQTEVRIYHSDYDWDQKNRWCTRHSGLQFENSGKALWSIASNSRLFVGTYNATTYIDALCKNIPTVIFWDKTQWEIKTEAEPFFSDFKKVGVFHETPESAANHVNHIWSDIDYWWNSVDVQKARINFLNTYSSNMTESGEKILDKLEKRLRLAMKS